MAVCKRAAELSDGGGVGLKGFELRGDGLDVTLEMVAPVDRFISLAGLNSGLLRVLEESDNRCAWRRGRMARRVRFRREETGNRPGPWSGRPPRDVRRLALR